MSYYEELGISPEASQEEIEKAYKSMAKLHHPDKGGDEAKFHEIKQAYDILSNPQNRAKFDRGEEINQQSLREQALGHLNSVMTQVLTEWGFMPEHSDLIRRMREEINDVSIKIEKDIENVEHDIGKMDIVMGRLRNAEILFPFLTQQKRLMIGRKEELEYQREVQSEMLNLIEGAIYDTTPDEDDTYLQKELDL